MGHQHHSAETTGDEHPTALPDRTGSPAGSPGTAGDGAPVTDEPDIACAANTPGMATMLTIRHDHTDGTRLDGSARGDGAYEVLQPLGWTYRPWAGVHIRGSRDTFAYPAELEKHAQALREAGFTVTVAVDNTWRPAAVRWAEREQRADGRADRYDDRAGRATDRGNAREAAARRTLDGIPLGQPMMPGHPSYRADRNRRERAWANQNAARAEHDNAEQLSDRAAGARANERAKHNPRAIMRKIESLEVEIRRAERGLADGATGEWADITRLRLARDRDEVVFLRGRMAEHADTGTFVAWSPASIAKGDLVRVESFGWYPVKRVNRKTVSLDTTSWPHTAEWDRITGRRRDGMQWDTPNGQPWPVEQAERVARWTNLLAAAGRDAAGDTEKIMLRVRVQLAQRIVHGLPGDVGDPAVSACQPPTDDGTGWQPLMLAYLAVYEQLESGRPAEQVRAEFGPPWAGVKPAWRMPIYREPEPRRAGPSGFRNDAQPVVRSGDLVYGVYDRGASGHLATSFCGPVADVSAVNHRREAGDWVTIRLVDGTEQQLQTHRWLAVFPVGTWQTEPDSVGVEPDALARAEQAGRHAYGQGRPAAPAADATVTELISGLPVGGGAAANFQAFTRGYEAAGDLAAAQALADVPADPDHADLSSSGTHGGEG